MDEKEARNYAWEHFKLHAAQRFTTFNYFIVLAVLMTTALGTALNKDFHYPELACYLSILLVVTAFVFWKLDQRGRQLLEVSKNALKHLEGSLEPREPEYWALFQNEIKLTEARRKDAKLWQPHRWHLTYLHCFGTLYVLFAALGGLGLYVSWPRFQMALLFP
jgi:hypothetical protein